MILTKPKSRFLLWVFFTVAAISYLLNWMLTDSHVHPTVSPWAIIFGPFLYIYLEHPSIFDYASIAGFVALPLLIFFKDNTFTRATFVIGISLWFLSGCAEVWKGW